MGGHVSCQTERRPSTRPAPASLVIRHGYPDMGISVGMAVSVDNRSQDRQTKGMRARINRLEQSPSTYRHPARFAKKKNPWSEIGSCKKKKSMFRDRIRSPILHQDRIRLMRAGRNTPPGTVRRGRVQGESSAQASCSSERRPGAGRRRNWGGASGAYASDI